MKVFGNKLFVAWATLESSPYSVSRSCLNKGTVRFRAKQSKSWANIKDPDDNRQVLIEYATIPSTTRRLYNLPSVEELWSIYHKNQKETILTDRLATVEIEAASLAAQLKEATGKKLHVYYKQYQHLGHARAVAYGEQHSLWARLLELRPQHTVADLFTAYHLVEPNGYKSADSFGNALRRAATVGLEKFVRHGNEGNTNARTALLEHEYWVRLIASQGRGFEAPYIFNKVNELCRACEVRPLGSVSWVKHYLARPDVRADIDAYRYGAAYGRAQQPYLTLQTALHANDQWQIDGWQIPIYYLVKRRNKHGQQVNGYKKLTAVVVRDAHSRRAVGYAFGESENTALILQALRHAVQRTGRLPAEIVSDNHSFHETQEAGNFKELLRARGTTWTVTSNPQYKSLVERGFLDFEERFCKNVQGWTGSSPRNRKTNAKLKPEQREELLKTANCPDANTVTALVARLLEKFNESPLNALRGATPNDAYTASEQPHAPQADDTDVLHLFWKTTRLKVGRGMVILTSGGERYRFYLPGGDTYRRTYQQEVTVRYDDDLATVYLFDVATDALICQCGRQAPTHGALVNQGPADMSTLAKHGHRLKANKEASRRKNEELADYTDERHGEAPYEALNPISAPKDVYLSAQAEYEVGQLLKEAGVNVATLPERAQSDPLKGTPFSSAARAKRREAKGNTATTLFQQPPSLRRIGQNEGYEDDE